MPSTVLVIAALVLAAAVVGALLVTAMTTFEQQPRYLRTPPAPQKRSVVGRHRARGRP